MYFLKRNASTAFLLLQSLFITLVLTTTFLLSSLVVWAAPYGEGEYGQGNYSEGQITGSPAPSPSPSPAPQDNNTQASSSNQESSRSSSDAKNDSCSADIPTGVPDLFQINAGKDSLTLFFTPVTNPRDRYVVAYGTQAGVIEHAFEFINNENGVIQVDVKSLQPRTPYYFKVRAGNGCSPGSWSNELAAATGQGRPTYRWSSVGKILASALNRQFRPNATQKVEIDTATPQVETQQPNTNAAPTPKPTSPSNPVRIAPTQPTTPVQPTPAPSPQPQGLFGRLRNFLQSIF